MEKDKISFLNKNEQFILENVLFLRQLIKQKKASPEDYHQLGISYFLIKNYEKSIDVLDELLNKYPQYIDINKIYKLKILCLLHLKKFKEAINLIQKRLYYNQQDISFLHMLAYAYEKLNQYSEALKIHKKVLNLDPENPTSLNAYGYLLTLYGNPNTLPIAKQCFEKVLKKNPENPYYLDSYAMYLNKVGQKDQAREILLKALQKDPENTEILFHLKEI
ncbi:MAG: tetratricopeptide repeat protein [Leptonema sp. (in: bacteria)]